MKPILERFSNSYHVDSNGCWIWRFRTNSTGYGIAAMPKGVKMKAHRLSYFLFNGVLPDNLNVCHKCDNRKCVNPKHLFLGTQKDNITDMHSKNRWRSKKAKLSPLFAKVIKEALCVGYSQSSIGRYFGVRQTTISDVARGKTWKRV